MKLMSFRTSLSMFLILWFLTVRIACIFSNNWVSENEKFAVRLIWTDNCFGFKYQTCFIDSSLQ